MPTTTEVLCGNCNEPIEVGARYKVRVGAQGQTVNERWCSSCTSEYTKKCSECNTRYSKNDNTADENLIYVGERGSTRSVYCYFNDCYIDSVRFCPHDGAANFINNAYCSECNTDEAGNTRRCQCGGGSESEPVHRYDCEPTLVFHGESQDNLFMGFELETQVANTNLRDASLYAMHELQSVEIAQLKNDGSIGGGFEIVTQPHTYEAYRDNLTLWNTIETLRKEYRARSWDSGTCGLHIHVSRKAFGSGKHTHRFIEFIYRNSDMMMKFGGRKSTYARFNDVWGFDEFDKPIFTLEGKSDRSSSEIRGGEKYTAVNTLKRDTLELRFMRGTMNTEGVKAGLGLAHALVQYTRELNDSEADWYNWQGFVDYVNGIPYIYPELIARLPEVPELVLSQLDQLKIDA